MKQMEDETDTETELWTSISLLIRTNILLLNITT